MTALFDQVKGAKDIPEALEKVDQWMSALLYDAQYANVHSTTAPEILQDAEFSHGKLFHAHFKDTRSLYWFSEHGVHSMAQAIKNVAGQLRVAAQSTPNSVQDADAAIKQASIKEEAENAEMRDYLAAWHGEMIHLAKNLKVIDDKDVYFANDAQHAKDLGDKVGAKCYEMRTQIKDLKVISSAQATTITEHKTALNAAHDEIAKLKAELAALKAAPPSPPPSPPPSDPLTTAYAVIGEMVVKSRQG